MASSIACSGCGQNPCGHLGEELGQLLPLPGSSAAGRAARAVPRSWPGPGGAWQESGRSPDWVPGESQRALLACRSAFLPTRFPGSADPRFDSWFLSLTPWTPGSPEHRVRQLSQGAFSGWWWGPLLMAGLQPRSILRNQCGLGLGERESCRPGDSQGPPPASPAGIWHRKCPLGVP